MTTTGRTTAWPTDRDIAIQPETTAILTVNYNTLELVTQLVWSIHDRLGPGGFAKLVVVDNASTDGSLDVLHALHEAGRIELIALPENRYHGPALTIGLDHLAQHADGIGAVWVIDSDCVVLRPDALVDATAAMRTTGAALAGQPVNDAWSNGEFGLHALLLDPAQVWRDPIVPFLEHGNPGHDLQTSCAAAGLVATPFPFTAAGYVVHLGRGTLAQIAARDDRTNRYAEWAKDHHEPHFAEETTAAAAYAEFREAFRAAVPDLAPGTMLAALTRPRD